MREKKRVCQKVSTDETTENNVRAYLPHIHFTTSKVFPQKSIQLTTGFITLLQSNFEITNFQLVNIPVSDFFSLANLFIA